MAAERATERSWEHHDTIWNIFSPKEPRQPSIYEILSQIEKHNHKNLEHRVSLLIAVWTCLAGKAYYLHRIGEVFHFIYKESAMTILSGHWAHVSPVYKRGLARALIQCSQALGNVVEGSTFLCTALVMTIYDPWGDPVLRHLLDSEDGISQELVTEYIKSEPHELLLMRIESLVKANCEEAAVHLCRCCLKCGRTPTSNTEGKKKVDEKETWRWPFLEWLMRLLFRRGQLNELVSESAICSCHDGVRLIYRVRNCAQAESEALTETLINLFLIRDLLFPSRYCCTRELMKLWCDFQVQKQRSISEVQETAQKLLIIHASTSAHFYLFVDVLWEQYGISLLSLYLEMYVRGLTTDLNFLEAARQAEAQESVLEMENHMAAMYFKLASLFSPINKEVARECMLSSFSLEPTRERLELIRTLSEQISEKKAAQSKRQISVAQTLNTSELCQCTDKNIGQEQEYFIAQQNTETLENSICDQRIVGEKNIPLCDNHDIPGPKEVNNNVDANNAINIAEKVTVCVKENQELNEMVCETEGKNDKDLPILSKKDNGNADIELLPTESKDLVSICNNTEDNKICGENGMSDDCVNVVCNDNPSYEIVEKCKDIIQENADQDNVPTNKEIEVPEIEKSNEDVVTTLVENHLKETVIIPNSQTSDSDINILTEKVNDESKEKGNSQEVNKSENDVQESDCISDTVKELTKLECENGRSDNPEMACGDLNTHNDTATEGCECRDKTVTPNVELQIPDSPQENDCSVHLYPFPHVVIDADIPDISSALLKDFIIVLESLRNRHLKCSDRWEDIKQTCEDYLETVSVLRSMLLQMSTYESADSEADSTSEPIFCGNKHFGTSHSNDSMCRDCQVDKSPIIKRFMNYQNGPNIRGFVNLSDIHYPRLPLDRLLRAEGSSSRFGRLKGHRRHRYKEKDPARNILRKLHHDMEFDRELIKRKKKKKRKAKREKDHGMHPKKHHFEQIKGERDFLKTKKKRRKFKKKKDDKFDFASEDYCSDLSSTELMNLVNEHANVFSKTDQNPHISKHAHSSVYPFCSNPLVVLSDTMSDEHLDNLNKKTKRVNFGKLKEKKNKFIKSQQKHLKHQRSLQENKFKERKLDGKRNRKKAQATVHSVQQQLRSEVKNKSLKQKNSEQYPHIVQISSVKQMQAVQIHQSSLTVDLSGVASMNEVQQNSSHFNEPAVTDPDISMQESLQPSLQTCTPEELMKVQLLIANQAHMAPSPDTSPFTKDNFQYTAQSSQPELLSSSSNNPSVLKYVCSKMTSHLLSVAESSKCVVVPSTDASSSGYIKSLNTDGTDGVSQLSCTASNVQSDSLKQGQPNKQHIIISRTVIPVGGTPKTDCVSATVNNSICGTSDFANSPTADLLQNTSPLNLSANSVSYNVQNQTSQNSSLTALTIPISHNIQDGSGNKVVTGKLVIPLNNCASAKTSTTPSKGGNVLETTAGNISSAGVTSTNQTITLPGLIIVKGGGRNPHISVCSHQQQHTIPAAAKFPRNKKTMTTFKNSTVSIESPRNIPKGMKSRSIQKKNQPMPTKMSVCTTVPYAKKFPLSAISAATCSSPQTQLMVTTPITTNLNTTLSVVPVSSPLPCAQIQKNAPTFSINSSPVGTTESALPTTTVKNVTFPSVSSFAAASSSAEDSSASSGAEVMTAGSAANTTVITSVASTTASTPVTSTTLCDSVTNSVPSQVTLCSSVKPSFQAISSAAQLQQIAASQKKQPKIQIPTLHTTCASHSSKSDIKACNQQNNQTNGNKVTVDSIAISGQKPVSEQNGSQVVSLPLVSYQTTPGASGQKNTVVYTSASYKLTQRSAGHSVPNVVSSAVRTSICSVTRVMHATPSDAQLQPLVLGGIQTAVRAPGLLSTQGKIEGAGHVLEVPTRSLTSISDAVRFSLMDMDDATGSVENQVKQAFQPSLQETSGQMNNQKIVEASQNLGKAGFELLASDCNQPSQISKTIAHNAQGKKCFITDIPISSKMSTLTNTNVNAHTTNSALSQINIGFPHETKDCEKPEKKIKKVTTKNSKKQRGSLCEITGTHAANKSKGTGEKTRKLKVTTTYNRSQTKSLCVICGKFLYSVSNLKRHKKTVHKTQSNESAGLPYSSLFSPNTGIYDHCPEAQQLDAAVLDLSQDSNVQSKIKPKMQQTSHVSYLEEVNFPKHSLHQTHGGKQNKSKIFPVLKSAKSCKKQLSSQISERIKQIPKNEKTQVKYLKQLSQIQQREQDNQLQKMFLVNKIPKTEKFLHTATKKELQDLLLAGNQPKPQISSCLQTSLKKSQTKQRPMNIQKIDEIDQKPHILQSDQGQLKQRVELLQQDAVDATEKNIGESPFRNSFDCRKVKTNVTYGFPYEYSHHPSESHRIPSQQQIIHKSQVEKNSGEYSQYKCFHSRNQTLQSRQKIKKQSISRLALSQDIEDYSTKKKMCNEKRICSPESSFISSHKEQSVSGVFPNRNEPVEQQVRHKSDLLMPKSNISVSQGIYGKVAKPIILDNACFKIPIKTEVKDKTDCELENAHVKHKDQMISQNRELEYSVLSKKFEPNIPMHKYQNDVTGCVDSYLDSKHKNVNRLSESTKQNVPPLKSETQITLNCDKWSVNKPKSEQDSALNFSKQDQITLNVEEWMVKKEKAEQCSSNFVKHNNKLLTNMKTVNESRQQLINALECESLVSKFLDHIKQKTKKAENNTQDWVLDLKDSEHGKTDVNNENYHMHNKDNMLSVLENRADHLTLRKNVNTKPELKDAKVLSEKELNAQKELTKLENKIENFSEMELPAFQKAESESLQSSQQYISIQDNLADIDTKVNKAKVVVKRIDTSKSDLEFKKLKAVLDSSKKQISCDILTVEKNPEFHQSSTDNNTHSFEVFASDVKNEVQSVKMKDWKEVTDNKEIVGNEETIGMRLMYEVNVLKGKKCESLQKVKDFTEDEMVIGVCNTKDEKSNFDEMSAASGNTMPGSIDRTTTTAACFSYKNLPLSKKNCATSASIIENVKALAKPQNSKCNKSRTVCKTRNTNGSGLNIRTRSSPGVKTRSSTIT